MHVAASFEQCFDIVLPYPACAASLTTQECLDAVIDAANRMFPVQGIQSIDQVLCSRLSWQTSTLSCLVSLLY